MNERRLTDIGIELAGELPPLQDQMFDEDDEIVVRPGMARHWRDIAEELYNTLNGLGRRLHSAVVELDDEVKEDSWAEDPDVDALREEAAALFGRPR